MPETRRLKLTLSYDGSEFAGWQSQRHGNTVQDAIENALARICGEQLTVVGAGRTDAGVHALGQCAHIDVPGQRFAAAEWLKALNGTLPLTIRVLDARFVAHTFHARFSARGKLYRYRVLNSEVHSPFELGRAWHVPRPLDVAKLKESGGLFVGQHDFRAFAANRGKADVDTVRRIDAVRIARAGDVIAIDISGEGFLYKMARMIVGAMVRCALGKEPVSRIGDALRKTVPAAQRFVAPADGLYLVRIRYR